MSERVRIRRIQREKCLYLCVCRVCKKAKCGVFYSKKPSKREERQKMPSHSTKIHMSHEFNLISMQFSLFFCYSVASNLSLSLSSASLVCQCSIFIISSVTMLFLFIVIFHKLMKQCDIESYLSAFVYVCVFVLSE